MLRWQHFYHVLYTKTDTLKVRTRTKVYQGDRTFLDETLTVTPVSAHRPKLTQALLQQRLYRTSETPLKLTITRLLQPYDIRVAHKLIRRLHVLANVKDIKTDRRTDKEYYTKIKCCQTTYIGEAGGKFSSRLTEHKRATRNGDTDSKPQYWTPFTEKNIKSTCVKYTTGHSHY